VIFGLKRRYAMSNRRYYGTVCWDGYKDSKDGEETTVADSVRSLVEGIELSLEDHKKRGAYFECASIESNTFHKGYKEITDLIKKQLKARRKNGKQ
jgi:methylphosphotriester-DNA--protein-cysteine methyltransferase|tara:strand:+ start:4596 stop:4883 length:288 start_codon:yes stop_codon:yes gene_type:complete